MNNGKIVFAQIMSFLPDYEFNKCVTLTGNYTYSDTNGDEEGTSTFQWYYSTGSDGSSATFISGATGSSHTLSNIDHGI